MKISLDIDCTPEEARRFLGLPDVTPVNDGFVEVLAKRTSEMAEEIDIDKLAEQWMTAGAQGLGNLQRIFMEQFSAAQPKKD